jgi:hypothetical protein
MQSNSTPQIQKISHTHSWLEKVQMENKNFFDVLVIKPGSIKNVSWMDPKYSFKLMELNLFESVKTNEDNFLEVIATKLDVNKYKVKDLFVKNEFIGEEPYYLYEMIYIDLEKEKEYHTEENLNELASLINTNGDQIYSNAIIFRNHLPSLTDSMNLCTVTKNDLARILHERVHTKIVTCDDGIWVQDECVGELEKFAEIFFDDEKYIKLEIPFLMHNINIWYTTTAATDDNNQLCGSLVNSPVDKCIWFSMKSEEFRGNLTLDEVNKIIYLSKKLSDFKTPNKYTEEQTDNIGRKIIYNRFKVLDSVYNENKDI